MCVWVLVKQNPATRINRVISLDEDHVSKFPSCSCILLISALEPPKPVLRTAVDS